MIEGVDMTAQGNLYREANDYWRSEIGRLHERASQILREDFAERGVSNLAEPRLKELGEQKVRLEQLLQTVHQIAVDGERPELLVSFGSFIPADWYLLAAGR